MQDIDFQSVTVMGAQINVSVWDDGAGPVHIDTPAVNTPKHAQREMDSGTLPGN